MDKQTLTQSRLRNFRACPRMHKLHYLDLLDPVRRGAEIRFGSLFHVGLEAWWSARMRAIPETRLEHALAEMQVAARRDDTRADEYEYARARALMEGYDARWGAEDWQTIAVEAEFSTSLRNPETGATSRTFRLGGKIDAIAKSPRDGRVYIVEHKTASSDISDGSEYWRRLRLDGQVSMYYAGGKALGHDVAGCVYDVALRPAYKPYKATPAEKRKFTAAGALHANQRDRDETPAEFLDRCRAAIAEEPAKHFVRGVVVRLQSEIEEFEWDVWQVARNMREAEVSQRHPRNPDACVQYNRTCDYFDICTGAASADDPHLYRRRERLNAELGAPQPQLPAPAATGVAHAPGQE